MRFLSPFFSGVDVCRNVRSVSSSMFVIYHMGIFTVVNPCDHFCFYYYQFPSVNFFSVSPFHCSLISVLSPVLSLFIMRCLYKCPIWFWMRYLCYQMFAVKQFSMPFQTHYDAHSCLEMTWNFDLWYKSYAGWNIWMYERVTYGRVELTK